MIPTANIMVIISSEARLATDKPISELIGLLNIAARQNNLRTNRAKELKQAIRIINQSINLN